MQWEGFRQSLKGGEGKILTSTLMIVASKRDVLNAPDAGLLHQWYLQTCESSRSIKCESPYVSLADKKDLARYNYIYKNEFY